MKSPELAAILLVVAPILVQALKVIKIDVAKWPRWLQPVPAVLIAGLPVLIVQLQAKVPVWSALLAALLEGLGAIGMYHVVRGPRPGEKPAPVEQPEDKPPPTMRGSAALLVLLALALSGCSASLEEARLAGLNPQAKMAAAPPSARCASLDNQHRTWGAVGKTAAVLAGAEGLSTIPAPNDKWRTGLAAGTAATAALAAGAVYVSESAAASWARECK